MSLDVRVRLITRPAEIGFAEQRGEAGGSKVGCAVDKDPATVRLAHDLSKRFEIGNRAPPFILGPGMPPIRRKLGLNSTG
jgi:hypothetical protein